MNYKLRTCLPSLSLWHRAGNSLKIFPKQKKVKGLQFLISLSFPFLYKKGNSKITGLENRVIGGANEKITNKTKKKQGIAKWWMTSRKRRRREVSFSGYKYMQTVRKMT